MTREEFLGPGEGFLKGRLGEKPEKASRFGHLGLLFFIGGELFLGCWRYFSKSLKVPKETLMFVFTF